MDNLSYHISRRVWHPQSHKFDCPSVATVMADQAIREAKELREKLRDHRILEDKRFQSS